MVKTASLTAIASLAAAAAFSSVGGGAGHAQDPSGEPGGQCVHLRAINGYQVIDDQHLVLTGGASRYYLVTTRSRCSGLRFGAQIGTSFGDNARLCQPMVEYVIPDDGWRCAIDTIEEVESLEAVEQLIATRAEDE